MKSVIIFLYSQQLWLQVFLFFPIIVGNLSVENHARGLEKKMYISNELDNSENFPPCSFPSQGRNVQTISFLLKPCQAVRKCLNENNPEGNSSVRCCSPSVSKA